MTMSMFTFSLFYLSLATSLGTLTRPQHSSTFRPCNGSLSSCSCRDGESFCSYMGLTETNGEMANYSGCMESREVASCCLTSGWSYLSHAHAVTCVPNVATVVMKGEGAVNEGVKDCRDRRYPYCRGRTDKGGFTHTCLHRSLPCNGKCGALDTWCDVTRTCLPSTDYSKKCLCEDGARWCRVTGSCITGECKALKEDSSVLVGLVSGCVALLIVVIVLLVVCWTRTSSRGDTEKMQNITFTA